MPGEVLDRLGVQRLRSVSLVLADGRRAQRDVEVDKKLEKRLAEGLEDFRAGRCHGPFDSAKEEVRYLHTEAKRRKKTKAS